MKKSLFCRLFDGLNIHWWEYYIRFKVSFEAPNKKGERFRIPYLFRMCGITGKKQEICIWRSEKLIPGKITNWKAPND